jgi:hypothetical protein
MIGERPKYGTEDYFRALYPNMPDERVYPLLVIAAENPDVHKKELKSLLIKKCRHLASQSKSDQA